MWWAPPLGNGGLTPPSNRHSFITFRKAIAAAMIDIGPMSRQAAALQKATTTCVNVIVGALPQLDTCARISNTEPKRVGQASESSECKWAGEGQFRSQPSKESRFLPRCFLCQRALPENYCEAKGEQMAPNTTYEAPKVITLDSRRIMSALGPSLSCTGFGGAVDC